MAGDEVPETPHAHNEPPNAPACLDRIFFSARTFRAWRHEPLPTEVLHRLYDALRMGPTANNSAPARFVFIASQSAKDRLEPHLSEGNRAKVRAAPVCAIVAYDLDFPKTLAKLDPKRADAPAAYRAPERIEETAFRNSSLQGAYLIMAARAMGLDCGPMSGFDRAGVDQAFFAGSNVKSNFLCCIGHGDRSSLRPRLPRLAFEDACTLL